MYSYHVYCSGEGDPKDLQICNQKTEKILDKVGVELQRLDVGGILTEFGAIDKSENGLLNLDYIFDKVDG